MNINLSSVALKFRATVCNSSNAAFKLGCRNPEARNFCRKIIQVKNNNAHSRLVNLSLSPRERTDLLDKTVKYNVLEYKLSILDNLKKIAVKSDSKTSDLSNPTDFVKFAHNANKESLV